jgi:hypothetical protein
LPELRDAPRRALRLSCGGVMTAKKTSAEKAAPRQRKNILTEAERRRIEQATKRSEAEPDPAQIPLLDDGERS